MGREETEEEECLVLPMVNLTQLERDRNREVFTALAHEAGVALTKANYKRWLQLKRRLAGEPKLLDEILARLAKAIHAAIVNGA